TGRAAAGGSTNAAGRAASDTADAAAGDAADAAAAGGGTGGGGGGAGRRDGWVREGERAEPADRVGLDLEVEVHADSLEEVVADLDEPDLDGDLEVLEPPELPEEVNDLVVDLGGVADDQADIEEERGD